MRNNIFDIIKIVLIILLLLVASGAFKKKRTYHKLHKDYSSEYKFPNAVAKVNDEPT